MKNVIILAVWVVISMTVAQAQTPAMRSYFCALETPHEGIKCSEIKKSLVGMAGRLCASWASEEGLPLAGTFSNTSAQELYVKQKEVCDFLPGKGKWACFLEQRCETTSSLSPVGMHVFSPAGDKAAARALCVQDAWSAYQTALMSLPSDCLMGPDAAMLQF